MLPEYTNSCGFTELYPHPEDEGPDPVIGSITDKDTCPSPWFKVSGLSGYILLNESGLPALSCSFYRSFEYPQTTGLKLSETIEYKAGFYYYEDGRNVTASGITASMKSWVLSDQAYASGVTASVLAYALSTFF